VSIWSDGSFSWVPYLCPDGVDYLKSQSNGVQPVGGDARTQRQPGESITPLPALSWTLPTPPGSGDPVLPVDRLRRWRAGQEGMEPE